MGAHSQESKASGSLWWAVPPVAVFLLYGRSIEFEGITDDGPLLLDNPFLHGPIADLWTSDLWGATAHLQSTQYYRPLVMTTFWLQSLVGVSAAWFRVGNLVLFAAAAALLLVYLRRRVPGLGAPLAALVSTLWAVHPIQSEAVVWLSGRFDLLLLLTVVGGLLANTATVERRRILVPVLLLLGLFSKEVAVCFGLALVVDDVEAGRSFAGEWRKYLGVAFALLLVQACRSRVGVVSVEAMATVSLSEGWRSFAALAALYGKLLLVPSGFDVHHWYAPAGITTSLGVSAVLIALVAFAATSFGKAARLGMPLALAVGSLVPASLVGPNQRIFGDRFAGLFWLGVVLALSSLLGALRPRVGERRVGFGVALATLGVVPFAWQRIGEWRDESTLRGAALAREPDHPHWLVLEAHAALKDGDTRRARGVLARVIALEPLSPKAHNAMCVALLRERRFDEASASCERATTLAPSNPRAWVNRASVSAALARWQEVRGFAEQALGFRARYPEATYLRALALANLGQTEEAAAETSVGLTLEPNHAGLRQLSEQLARARDGRSPPPSP